MQGIDRRELFRRGASEAAGVAGASLLAGYGGETRPESCVALGSQASFGWASRVP
jgi:hypothetical protein